jgi:hypothetical protein
MYNTTYNTRPCVQLYNCACCRLQLVAASCRLRTAQPALNCQSTVGTILHHRPLHHRPSWVRRRTQCGTSFTNLMSRTGPKRRRQFAAVVGAAAARLRSHISACSKRASSIGQLNLGFTAPPRKKTKTATSSSGDPSTAKAAEVRDAPPAVNTAHICSLYQTIRIIRIIRIIQPTFQKFIKHSSMDNTLRLCVPNVHPSLGCDLGALTLGTPHPALT